jgi:hypothetical protein
MMAALDDGIQGNSATGLLPITRVAFVVLLSLSLLSGISLFVLTTRTADFFAWTIGVPLTAAFMGAGYWAALPTFVLSLRSRHWQHVRILLVAILVFTVFIAVATLRNLGSFHLATGPVLARAGAWLWLAVYLIAPPLIAVSIVLQERAGGRREYAIRRPVLGWVKAALLAQGVVMTVVGLGLTFLPGQFAAIWPWTVPPLSAQAIAAWLLSIAAASWWGLRDRDWQRIRIAIPFYLIFYVLQLIGVFRFRQSLTPDTLHATAYVVVLVLAFVLTALAAWSQEMAGRRLASPGHLPMTSESPASR